MLIELLERATLSSTWSPFSSYVDQCLHKMTCHSFQCLGNIQNVSSPFIGLGWSPTIVAPNDVMSWSWWHLCSHNNHQPLTSKHYTEPRSRPSCKPIRTKRLNYYHLSQRPNENLSLRPYPTILAQINHNLQGCTVKSILVLTQLQIKS